MVFYAGGKVELRRIPLDVTLATAKMRKLQYNKDCPFRIVVNDKELEVFVNGKKVLTHQLDEDLDGIWGLARCHRLGSRSARATRRALRFFAQGSDALFRGG